MGKMEVILTNNSQIEDIAKVEEGENGVFLHRNTGSVVEKVGYVPYNSLFFARPAEE
ncbi:hypothetical protein HUG10_19745 (plasmid) [Halorarum halophilum]|uniref:Uncharacterized protein n=1 Tax=Halorarum halophilum TaxID=2743090 RepID=A0A7D5GEI9_9EURY|nr:hypothetical protein [Halobaculum halophilum]QLG29846.1 hypothetical protein HUG10_19745 [Halobaculum halophilum]